MGQKNADRLQYKAREIITSSINAARQTMVFTNYFVVGDYVDVFAINSSGEKVGSNLATNIQVSAIQKGVAVVFSAAVDTTTALPAGAVGWYVGVRDIDDSQEAIDRLYRKKSDFGAPGNVQISATVVDDSLLDVDITGAAQIGHSVQFVDSISILRVGDSVQVLADSGLLGNATIVALDAMADAANNMSRIQLDSAIDTTGETNVSIVAGNLTIDQILARLQQNVDSIDQPIENEDLDAGNGIDCVFETDNLFLYRTSKVLIDGVRKVLGTAGTRASKVIGTFPTANDSMKADSMILGTLGNEVELEILNVAGNAITVTKSYKVNAGGSYALSQYKISIANNSGASTAKQLCDLLNAHAQVRRIAQFRYGGDGSGTIAAMASSNFTGGLNDGTKDYAELEQVFNNQIVNTGFKFIALRIDAANENRLNHPPLADEDLTADYRKALTNA